MFRNTFFVRDRPPSPQAVEGSSIRTRLDVVLRNPETNKNIKEFSMACSFYSTLTGLF